ncbi:efflux RND transporter periplasmic adaptor subunit [Methylocapsa sp. S129]|uniref:efflux RND transporter periplasmic adaptor subunit n=1 Tax=Methylocapsa sp. S129 TaxID=1641869 RepID=UPI00131B0993|nr:efflux RND transporter periplasmic adaptor subunit [Methylocapsa sp. S129]
MRYHFVSPQRPLAQAVIACAALFVLAGCQPSQTANVKVATPVRTVVLALTDYEPDVSLTGEIKPQFQSDVSFRVSGRILERNVDVGDHVSAGQTLAKIDPQEQNADVAAAQAVLDSANAQLRQVTATFERQKELFAKGFTTRREYDQAEAGARTAQGSVDSAAAQLAAAQERLGDTELKAGVAGIVTARNVEAGQVMQAAQAAFTIAQDGPRDAVFDIYESILGGGRVVSKVEVTLLSDPKTVAFGEVREIAPTVDMTTGTIRVKIGLDNSPPAMTLGALVRGVAHIQPRKVIRLPWSALSSLDDKPAVWILDPKTGAVSLRNFKIDRYRTGEIIVAEGLTPGEIVVTDGSQLLRPGQTISPSERGGA